MNMVDRSNHKSVITIGFLTPDTSKEAIISNFDIVCEDSDNYDDVKKLIFKLKKNEKQRH